MSTKPTYGAWQRHLLRNWHRPKLSQRANLALNGAILLATAMATWASDGERIYVSAEQAARCLDISERTAKTYRDIALRYGFLTDTGQREGRVRVLQIAIPPDACTEGATACTRPDLHAETKGASTCTMIVQQLARNTRDITSDVRPATPGVVESSDSRESSASDKLPDHKGGQNKGVPIVQVLAPSSVQASAKVQQPAPCSRCGDTSGNPYHRCPCPKCGETGPASTHKCPPLETCGYCHERHREGPWHDCEPKRAAHSPDVPTCPDCGMAHPSKYHYGVNGKCRFANAA